jgi:thioredoxin-like negative regulator of GroEL
MTTGQRTMQPDILSLNHLRETLQSAPAVIAYFSTPDCNVCKVLKPKIIELIKNKFPQIQFHYVDCLRHPEAAAQFSVFTIPTVLIYFDGRETFRLSRNFGITELSEKLRRPYQLLFE